jgi:hypothetical protein
MPDSPAFNSCPSATQFAADNQLMLGMTCRNRSVVIRRDWLGIPFWQVGTLAKYPQIREPVGHR